MRGSLSSVVCLALAAGGAWAQAEAPKGAPKAEPAPAKAGPEIARSDFAKPSFAYKVETVVQKVEVPWSIVWTPDGRMFFNERSGRVREYANGTLNPEPMYVAPVDERTGEIGLMGLCLHPDFAKNKYVYLSYGKSRDVIHVTRFTESGGKLTLDKEILSIQPAGRNHAGCRIAFGPDGKLYITTGEAFQRQLAQDMTSLGGKILRVNDDGSIPADNPFVGDDSKAKGVRPEIWSFGNRNPQGIDWQPGTGLLFESEHGPSGEAGTGADEVNLIEKGRNYGWPTVHHFQTKEGTEPPLAVWDPAVAPASAAFYNGDKFPALKGNLFVGLLGGLGEPRRPGIVRIVLDGRRIASQERFATEFGRIRCVAMGPDGYIYFSTSNRDGRGNPAADDDRIMRIVPDAPANK